MSEHYPLSNVRLFVVQKAYDPDSVAANTQAVNAATLTVNGIYTTDFVIGLKPTQTQGLFLKRVHCSAVNTLSFTFENTTGSGIDPGSETYTFLIFRPNAEIDDELA